MNRNYKLYLYVTLKMALDRKASLSKQVDTYDEYEFAYNSDKRYFKSVFTCVRIIRRMLNSYYMVDL